MTKSNKLPKYSGALIALVTAMARDVFLSEETQLFIVSALSTEDNVQSFNTWVSTKIIDGKFSASENEIVEIVKFISFFGG